MTLIFCLRHVAEALWDNHPRVLWGKPKPEATGTDTPNHRHCLMPTYFSQGNSACKGPWLSMMVISSARPPWLR